MRRAAAWTAVLATACALLLGGCDDEVSGDATGSQTAARPGARPTGSDHTTDPLAQPGLPAGGVPVVELLSPGAAPRRVLRYRLVPGTEETLVMKMSMTMQAEGEGQPATPIETPVMKMVMHIAIGQRRTGGETHYEFELRDTEVAGPRGMATEVVETARAALARAEGMAGSAVIDPRGFNHDLTMKLPAGMPPQMQQMMDGAAQGIDRMSTPLPAEAVGPGARWKLHQQIEQNGITIQQETLFELVALDGDRCTLQAQVTQRAGNQPMAMPGLPAGAVTLTGLQSTGTGTLEVDLDKLVPRSTLTLASEYVMQVAAEEPQTIETHLDMTVEIARR